MSLSKDGGVVKNWGLLGHEWAVEMLRNQVRSHVTRHAYLFTGVRGVGRRTLSLRFVQALSCPQAKETGEPCLQCPTCGQIEQMHYPNLSVIQAEREGGILKIDWLREARRSIFLTPYLGGYRFVLFQRFQETKESANALLKTLEEAPSHAILLLTADSTEQIPETIVSRCEVFRLRPLPVERLQAWLLEKRASEEQAHLLAHISAGCPGTALKMLAAEQTKPTEEDAEGRLTPLGARRERLDELVRLLGSNRLTRFAYAENIGSAAKKGAKVISLPALRETYLTWLSFWRDVCLQKNGNRDAVANVDYAGVIASLADKLSPAEPERLLRQAEESLTRLEGNVNARLLTEVLLLDWPLIT